MPLTDIDTEWSKALGLTKDLSGLGLGLGTRTTRYALVLDDLKVKYIGVRVHDKSFVDIMCLTTSYRLKRIRLKSLSPAQTPFSLLSKFWKDSMKPGTPSA